MNVLNYPQVLVVVIGLFKLLLIVFVVYLATYLVTKGLGTGAKLEIQLKPATNQKPVLKTYGSGLLLLILAFLIVNLFSTSFSTVYTDSYVVYLQTVGAQAIAMSTVFGLMLVGYLLLCQGFTLKLSNRQGKIFKYFLIVTRIFQVILIIVNFLPVLFYIIEAFVASGK